MMVHAPAVLAVRMASDDTDDADDGDDVGTDSDNSDRQRQQSWQYRWDNRSKQCSQPSNSTSENCTCSAKP